MRFSAEVRQAEMNLAVANEKLLRSEFELRRFEDSSGAIEKAIA
jgi:hypothetical protein